MADGTDQGPVGGLAKRLGINGVADFAAVCTALATIMIAVVTLSQLHAIVAQVKDHRDQLRKARTLEALEEYVNDPTGNAISKRIWVKSHGGTDYSDFAEVDHDALLLLNRLEGFATGIMQGVYDEQMVQDFLKLQICKSVCVFIEGKSGSIGPLTWKSSGYEMFEAEQYQNLVALHSRWWPSRPLVELREPGSPLLLER